MDTLVLEDIFACSTLPTLPAVAVRVIELTSDENVRLDDLAETIQNDQALAAKILRTVNSSLYGLRQKCTSIQKALVLLGLRPVKSLALGFSLVSSLDGPEGDTFDWDGYWRRGLNTAVGAKVAAHRVPGADTDDAFLAGLLQDIGMVAMYRALGPAYNDAVEEAGDHRHLTRLELARWENQHADIGARLAQRWRLPEGLVIPIRFHERPTAAPQPYSVLSRLLGLGNLAHDCLIAQDPAPAFRRFFDKAHEWFRISNTDAEQILRDITDSASQLAKTLGLECSTPIDADQVIANAEDRLAELAATEAEAVASPNAEALLVQHTWVDPVTGALGRDALDAGVNEAYRILVLEDEPFSVAHIVFPKLGSAADDADAVARASMAILRKHFDPCGGVICRMKPELFTVITPGVEQPAAATMLHECLADLKARSERTDHELPGVAFTSMAGIASAGPETKQFYLDGQKVVIAALNAMRTANRGGAFNFAADTPGALAA